jgi:hypothetical protein
MTDTARAMLQRLTPMAVKVAMLAAAGHPHVPNGLPKLEVSLADTEAAIPIVRRWQNDALRFAARIGESDFEQTLQRCLRLVQTKGLVRRWTIARTAQVERKVLGSIQDTLLDRDLISVVKQDSNSGPSQEVWRKTAS